MTLLLILEQVNNIFRHSQILDLLHLQRLMYRTGSSAHIVSSHINFWQAKEFVSFRAGLNNFFEGKVHPGITID